MRLSERGGSRLDGRRSYCASSISTLESGTQDRAQEGTRTSIVRWPRIFRSINEMAASVDAARDSLDFTSLRVDRLLHELRVERLDLQRRRWWSVGVGSVLALVAATWGWGLLLASTPQNPPAISPTGQIAVVSLDALPESITRVDADFSAANDERGTFSIAVSVYPSPAQNLLTSSYRPTLGFLFCGDLRSGLTLSEMNQGPQPSPSTVSSTLVDSAIGDLADCDYLEVTGVTNQVVLRGSTDTAFASNEGSRILYAFPGVVTPSRPWPIGTSTMLPLPPETDITVSLGDVPTDLQVSQSMPQIPADGELSWTWTLGAELPPSEYRVSGVLETQQASASVALFAAGALVGVAGAAVLWVLEAVVGVARKRKS